MQKKRELLKQRWLLLKARTTYMQLCYKTFENKTFCFENKTFWCLWCKNPNSALSQGDFKNDKINY